MTLTGKALQVQAAMDEIAAKLKAFNTDLQTQIDALGAVGATKHKAALSQLQSDMATSSLAVLTMDVADDEDGALNGA